LRYDGAVLIIAVGAILMLPPLQARLALASGPIAAWTDQRFSASPGSGFSGQFWIGALLGAIDCAARTRKAGQQLVSRRPNDS
jgi:hypothetical protein